VVEVGDELDAAAAHPEHASALVGVGVDLGRQRAAEAARDGRKREFAEYRGFAGEIPDPQDEDTFLRSRLSRIERPGTRDHYRRLLSLRRSLPREVRTEVEGGKLTVRRGGASLVVDFDEKTVALGP